MRLGKRRACVLVVLASMLGACSGLIGMEPLTVDPKEASTVTVVDASPPDTSAPLQLPSEDASVPIADTGPPKRRVFLTSTTTDGNVAGAAAADGGLNGADAICRDLAAKASLDGGTWRAWLSGPDTDAITRITSDGPYYRLDGVEAVSGNAQLASGSILASISVIEDGGFLPAGGNTLVWTGTGPNGKSSGHDCRSWASAYGVDVGTLGASDRMDGSWTRIAVPFQQAERGCGSTWAHLYCFEQ